VCEVRVDRPVGVGKGREEASSLLYCLGACGQASGCREGKGGG